MSALTVIQTLPALEVGGVERGTLEVAAELVRRGHRSIVISAGGRLVRELTATGSEHIEMSIGNKSLLTLRHIPVLRKIIQRERTTILHSRSRLPAWISYLAWRGLASGQRPRFVTSVHGPYSVNRYSKIMVAGEQVIAVSEFIRAYILKNYPDTDPARITVIPRGVSPGRFPHGHRPDASWLQQWHEEFPHLKGRYLIALPARITRWKGQEDFIEIIAALTASGVPVHGLIIGGPHPRRRAFLDELKEKIATMGVVDNITFTGHRNDIREIMSVSNIVLSLANKPEAFGRTALEALSMGVPVIAYDHGGAGEVLRAIFPEGLIEHKDISSAADLIKRFQQNRPIVPDHNPFQLQRMLDSTIAVYEKMAANN